MLLFMDYFYFHIFGITKDTEKSRILLFVDCSILNICRFFLEKCGYNSYIISVYTCLPPII